MKLLIALLTALLLTGCATTEMTHTSPDGFSVEWKSRTLWKNVQDAKVEWGDFDAELGSSSGSGNEALIACMLAPQLAGCPK